MAKYIEEGTERMIGKSPKNVQSNLRNFLKKNW